MLATYHSHTLFCDGTDTTEAMADAAFAAGYDIFGLSAHAPVPIPSLGNLAIDQVAPYVQTVRETAARYAGRMEVLAGLEIEWVPGLGIPSESEYSSVKIDFRIGSAHFVKPTENALLCVDGPQYEFDLGMKNGYGGDGSRLYRDYYREVANLVAAGGFEILGHLDIVKMHNQGNRWFDESSPEYLNAAFAVAEALEGTGIAAEVNTGGIARGKIKELYPSLPILKELKRRNVPIVIGADAHATGHLDHRWRRMGLDLIQEAGYRELAIFHQGKWTTGPVE